MLSNFQLGGRVLFQSFLLGQAEFRNTLQAKGLEQLRQRVIAAYHLEPLDEEQTRGYIEHRLRTAGWHDDPKFGEAAYAAIYKYSGGIPRRINTVCDRLLLFGALEELHEFDAAKIKTVVEELKHETSSADGEPAAVTERPAAKESRDRERPKKTAEPASSRREAPAAKPAAYPSSYDADGDLEARLAQLEQRVIKLEEALRRESARLRRAILLSDDFGEL
jgi:hypothetical protein